ncbi:MAG: alpha/beta hydrolase [Gemmataceae bacterium]|nr:alpha/beta hydrolase [Gemmataceae bacterium]
MRTLNCVLVALALISFPSAGRAGKGDGYEVEVIKDIAYHDARDADPERHKLDLYLPRGHKGFAVLVYVHGGGWTRGDKASFEKQAHVLARAGIGVAATNYRLTPTVRHPGHAQDVARAVAWTHRNISKHGGRADRLFLAGHSAGGHLVALLGTDESYLKAEKLSLDDIKGVIPISGVYTVRSGKEKGPFPADEEGARQASPQTHVKGRHPPFLILYADKDGKDFDKMAENFCQALEKTKGTAAVMKINDRTHGSILASMANRDDPAMQAMLGFLARHSGTKLKGVNP